MSAGSGAYGAAPTVPDGHYEETCGCDYCTHASWCGSEEHEHLDEAPLWPCQAVLDANGMTHERQFFEAEGASWEAWARQQHPEWFGGEPVASDPNLFDYSDDEDADGDGRPS